MPPKTPQNSFEHLQLANVKNDGWKITFLFGKAFFQGRTCCEFTANLSSNMCRRVDQLPSLYQPHSVGGLYTHYKDSLKFPFIPRWDDHAPWYFRPLLQDRGSYTNTPVSCPSPMEIERSDCGSTKHEFHPSIHPAASAGRCKKSLHPDPRPLKYPNASKLQPKRRESATSRSC